MDWIGGWLKQIVLIILFAAFIDLILPNQSMQRYVRVVISLVILLAILEPIMTLMQGSSLLNQGRLSAFLSAPVETGPNAERPMPSLAEIMKNAEALKQRNQAEWKDLVESKLSEMIRDRLDQEGFRTVKQVQVKVNDGGGEKPQIEKVRVVLANADSESADSRSGKNQPTMAPIQPLDVEPVRPVQVHIDLHSPAARDSEAVEALPAAASPVPNSSGDGSGVKAQVIRRITEDWGLRPEQVAVDDQSSGKDGKG